MDEDEEFRNQEIDGEVPEPQVTSADPEERKLARALRIQKRIETLKKQVESVGFNLLPEENERALLEKQIEASSSLLERLQIEGDEAITNVRVANETREVTRRDRETAKRHELSENLASEASEAEQMYQEIFEKWDTIRRYKDPLDINDSIIEQKRKCDELLNQKEEVIAVLREEINLAELKFNTDQFYQEEDVRTLIKRIDLQVDSMRRAYKSELQQIEDTIATERNILIEANKKKWDMLYKQRNEEEETNMIKKLALADEFIDAFYKTRVDHEERFRETKIFLESETEQLTKELEILKAACYLNGEKLDYNYQILKKREEENIIVRSQQKRLINKLQDEINRINTNTNKFKAESLERIAKLTFEIKKMRNTVFEVNAKTNHITLVNDEKYHEVWDVNEGRALNLLKRILKADEIVYQQLLGLEWKEPKKLRDKKKLPSVKRALEILEMKKSEENIRDGEKFDEEAYPRSLIVSVLDKVAFRSEFLVEQRLRAILPAFSENEQTLVKVDNVFNALDIKKFDEFTLLINYFLPYARCPICEEAHEKINVIEAKPSGTGTLKEEPIASIQTLGTIATIGTVATIGTAGTLESGGDAGVLTTDEHVLLPEMAEMVTGSPELFDEMVLGELQASNTELKKSDETQSTVGTPSASTITPEEDTSSLQFSTVVEAAGPEVQCNASHPVYIEPACVFKTLKDFVTDYTMVDDKVFKLPTQMDERQKTVSRMISKEDLQTFWGQFKNIFNQHSEDVWHAVLFGLKKYHIILKSRHQVYQKVKQLRKENEDLKHLLKNCPAGPTRRKPIKSKKSRLGYSMTASSTASPSTVG